MPVSPLIRFENVTKRFAAVTANAEVSISILPNTVHAIVGENGAGKSTIMKLLYGMYPYDEGKIEFKGQPLTYRSPQGAIDCGIGMVHQHFMLVSTLTVWQNVILGKEPSLGRLGTPEILKRLDIIQKEFGFSLELTAKTGSLSVGEQQQVEILKLLYRQADILILDEPTAVLTPQEVDLLFDRLKKLKAKNKTIIIITHKLREVLAFSEWVTVMRQGRAIETMQTSSLNENLLAEKIIGHKRKELSQTPPLPASQAKLKISDLSLSRNKKAVLQNISFEVQPGEIVGIAGIEGNGQQELVEVLATVEKNFSGEVFFKNQCLKTIDTYAAKQQGLSIIPPDRHKEGLILNFSVELNSILGHHRESNLKSSVFLSHRKVRDYADSLVEQFDIRPTNTRLNISSLSGGNQQKVIVGRESALGAELLIASHPTRGVDIGAMDLIHQHFINLKKKGTAILLLSSELDEILALSDRIFVIYQGKIIGETTRKDATERQLGLWMTRGSA